MPHRAQLMIVRGQNPAAADWRSIVQGSYHRTRGFLRKKLKSRVLTVDSLINAHGWACAASAPEDRVLLKRYSAVSLLDTSRSCEDTTKLVSSWSLKGHSIGWETMVDEETLIVGYGNYTSRQSKKEKIAVRISKLKSGTTFVYPRSMFRF
jgi:hypothetical protein